MTHYEATEKVIKDMPVEWYKDLLETLVIAAIKKNVFTKDTINIYVKEIEDNFRSK